MIPVSSKTNSKGIKYALCSDGDSYSVYKLCENYCRHSKGGIRRTWRYIEKGMTLEAAKMLYERRTK